MRTSSVRKTRNAEQEQRESEATVRMGEKVVKELEVDPQEKYSELAGYMQELRKFPALKKDEDYAYLFASYKNGNEIESRRARDLIVYGNARLVISIALRYTGRGLPLLDMLQEGMIGMLRAIEKFDITASRFSTYATWWIKQGITRALADKAEYTVWREPVHWQESVNSVRRACQELYLKKGRWPKEVEVYEWVKANGSKTAQKLTLADIVEMVLSIHTGKRAVRLDEPVGDDEGSDTLLDTLSEGPMRTETVVEARRLYVEYGKAIERIEAAVNELSPRNAMIVRLRFGMGDFDAMTLEEIGERYEVTRERIRQIEAKALETLQEKLGITAEQIAEIIEVYQDLEVLAHAL